MIDLPGEMYWPPRFNVTSASNPVTRVRNAGDGHGVVTSAPRAGTINKIRYYVESVSSADTIDARLETINATALPALGSGTLVSAGANVATLEGASGWKERTLGTPLSVSKGDRFVPVLSGAGAGDLDLGMSYLYGQYYPHTYNSPYVIRKHDGGAWAAYTYPALIYPMYDDGVYTQWTPQWPCNAGYLTFGTGSSYDENGIEFVAPFSTRATGIWLPIDADGTCKLRLYEDGVLQDEVSLVPNERGADGAINTQRYFASNYTIQKGQTYQLTVQATSATTVSMVEIDHGGTVAMLNAFGFPTTCLKCQKDEGGAFSYPANITTPIIGLVFDQIAAAGMLFDSGMTGGLSG